MDRELLEYDFDIKINENDVANFIYLSYQQKFIIWDWFPAGSTSFNIKDIIDDI